jgi:protein gp37
MAIKRLKPMSIGKYVKVIKGRQWDGTTYLNEEEIYIPFKWKTPRMVFVCSMGDLFHENVPHEWLKWVFQVIYENQSNIFVILTKRPERMAKFFSLLAIGNMCSSFPNLWIGVTAENQKQANQRIPILLQIPAAKRFVSIEPMLGPVDLTWIQDSRIHAIDSLDNNSITHNNEVIEKGLDWVICGGESGPKARPMHPDWVRSIRDQCASANVPFFFKQWGEWLPSYDFGERLDELIVDFPKCRIGANHEHEDGIQMVKVGRKAAGDMLDGKEHHEWPNNS